MIAFLIFCGERRSWAMNGASEIAATYDGGQLSSDGGVLILREIEKRLGIAAMLSACLPDTRDRSRVVHTHADMIRA